MTPQGGGDRRDFFVHGARGVSDVASAGGLGGVCHPGHLHAAPLIEGGGGCRERLVRPARAAVGAAHVRHTALRSGDGERTCNETADY